MQKIASVDELKTEIRRLLVYCQASERPSRQTLAVELSALADRVGNVRLDSFELFNRWHPYHNDLDLIDRQRRTLIGDGRFEIRPLRARALERKGLVDVVEGPFGEQLEMTSKGRRSLDESEDAWERMMNG